jgi:hypothetical protein
VKVDNPTAGDQDVYIHGLGTFRNGTTTTVDDEQVMRFRIMTATQKMSDFDEEGRFSVEQELGPEPHDLNIYGVTINKLGGDDTGDTVTVEGDVNVAVGGDVEQTNSKRKGSA